jgi:DNA mismatch repair protein MutH
MDSPPDFLKSYLYLNISIMTHTFAAPSDLLALSNRAYALTGLSLGYLAEQYHQILPISKRQAKGWVGALLETILNTTAKNLPEPDFMHLGVELKTLPLDQHHQPKESTYLCTAPLALNAQRETWETSRVRKKLHCILWIPFEADPQIPFAECRIGLPILWQPSPQETSVLQQDWEELMQALHLGNSHTLTAHLGTYLQIRPKAAHGKIFRSQQTDSQSLHVTTPKGFYLRSAFTRKILAENL